MSSAVPTVKFASKVTEVEKRLRAAFENLMLITPEYGIAPDEAFKFKQTSFDEFVRMVCQEHYGKIYSRKGIYKTIRDNIKGDFLDAVIKALDKGKPSERLKLLSIELKKLA
ncbi:MAG: hypothetical protein LBH09_06625 [Peptococcaceae bacterium]|nr:hypothetical protein [Peptococcaceae bacterium]